jgi:hypothetical protein
MENHFNQVMIDTYELLISKRIKWPYELDNDQKIEFMEHVIKYFSDIEDYIKCSEIQKKLNAFNKRIKKPKVSYGKENKDRNRC